MSYPRQDSVAARLQSETNRAIDVLRFKHARQLQAAWSACRRELHGVVANAYKTAAPSGDAWDLARFRGSGAQAGLQSGISEVLRRFRRQTIDIMRSGLHEVRRESILRHAWMLDQITPPSVKVKIPPIKPRQYTEADVVKQISGTVWNERWSAWLDSYSSSLNNNLTMGAMNGSGMEDAVDEVDSTRINTPATSIDNAMTRIYDFEAEAEAAAGEDDVVQANSVVIEKEIWKTRGDKRVCDRCSGNEGKSVNETDGDIPLHPNCNCYWLLVPMSYADLLASGDEEDRALADELFARGIVPNAIVIRGEGDTIAAKATVNFSSWSEGMMVVIGGM